MQQSCTHTHAQIEHAYPIVTLTYLLFDEAALRRDCRKMYNVMYAIFWALETTQASNIVSTTGFVPLDSTLRARVYEALGRVDQRGHCGKTPILARLQMVSSDSLVLLGVLLPLSGAWSSGTTIAGALPLAVDEVNADPTLLPGKTLDYIYRDSGCSVEAALQGFGTLTNKMNKMKQIDAVIGPGCSVGCEVQA